MGRKEMVKHRMEIRGAKDKQRGAVLVLFTAGLVVILGIAGLAIDGSHQMLNRARLQSAVDAAALASAKALDETATMAEARDAAQTMFDTNAGNLGNREMSAADITVTTTFSANSNPFIAGSYIPGEKGYVRVLATGFSMQMWLIQLLGATGKTVTASAVAGPSPSINYSCNLVPLIVCGDPSDVPTEDGPTFWGYENGDVHVLKSGSDGNGADCDFIGCGNFQLARLDGAGADDVRTAMAGGYAGCTFVDDSVPTEPGNTVGPVTQGLNTRLNKYSGPVSPEEYPPDVVTTQQDSTLQFDGTSITLDNGATIVNDADDLDFNLSDYQTEVAAANYDVSPGAGGQFDRRSMPLIIGNCDTAGSGQTTIDVLGFGCFFLLQEAIQKGNENEIYGEFGTECTIPGFSGPDPTVVPGPYVIQLYNDTLSRDS
jgi:Flp pilus assembly protein TadG